MPELLLSYLGHISHGRERERERERHTPCIEIDIRRHWYVGAQQTQQNSLTCCVADEVVAWGDAGWGGDARAVAEELQGGIRKRDCVHRSVHALVQRIASTQPSESATRQRC